MTVASWTDTEVERLVRAGLRRALETELGHVAVDVIDGRVSLRGIARSYAAKRRAGDIAQAAHGVRDVVNQLRVLPQ